MIAIIIQRPVATFFNATDGQRLRDVNNNEYHTAVYTVASFNFPGHTLKTNSEAITPQISSLHPVAAPGFDFI